MKLTPIAKALTVAATRLGMSASAYPRSTSMAVVTSPIRLAYEIGQWVLQINKLDGISTLDGAGVMFEMFVKFFKTKTDNAQLAESIAVEFHKTLRNEAGLHDTQAFAFFKSLADQLTLTDATALDARKTIQDLATSAEDHAVLLMKKAKDDGSSVSDALIEFVIDKLLADASFVSSHYQHHLGKPTDSAFSVLDIQVFGLVKELVDGITVTDDMDGEASALDDQEIQFVKQVTHAAAISDFIYIVLNVIRNFESLTAVVDVPLKAFDKSAFDVAGVASEQPVFSSQKVIVDFGATIDHLAKDSLKVLSIAGSVQDDCTFNNTASKSDSASISDTGSLVNQSYCSEDYFGQDYVGVSQTF